MFSLNDLDISKGHQMTYCGRSFDSMWKTKSTCMYLPVYVVKHELDLFVDWRRFYIILRDLDMEVLQSKTDKLSLYILYCTPFSYRNR